EIETAISFYADALGGELLWKIRDGRTWVAAVRLAETGPVALLANHLPPGDGLLVYRVRSLAEIRTRLEDRGWSVEGEPFELPQGPCLVFRDPARQRFAVYERVRPGVDDISAAASTSLTSQGGRQPRRTYRRQRRKPKPPKRSRM